MLGAAIIVVILLVIIPVSVIMTGAVGAALIGAVLKKDADDRGDEVWKQLNY